jgi:hypothetical protein
MIAFYYDVKGSCVEHTTDAPVFAVKAFERGYYPIYTRASAETLNHGVSAEVLESALIASLAGWNVPGARSARAFVEAAERREGTEADRAGRNPDSTDPEDAMLSNLPHGDE